MCLKPLAFHTNNIVSPVSYAVLTMSFRAMKWLKAAQIMSG